jgi:cystathionine beta-lyase
LDYPLPAPIAEALRRAIADSDTGYAWPAGLSEAFAAYAGEQWGWNVAPDRVTTLPDVLTGVAQALLRLTSPGDGVVITPPVYHPFFSVVTDVVGRRVVEAPLARSADDAYVIDLEVLERAFASPGVTAFLMSNPHNPTGGVATRDELRAVADLAARHGVAVISDEIHAPLVLPGAMHVPFLTVVDDDADAVALVSASKAWNLAGLKASQLVSTGRTARTVTARIPMEVTFTTGHLGVIAAAAAYREGGPWLADVVGLLDAQRRLLADLLAAELPRARYRAPEASYLAWIDLSAYGLGDDPAAVILERGRVGLSPGATFGTQGRGFVRLNFATSPAILREIVSRIARVVQ